MWLSMTGPRIAMTRAAGAVTIVCKKLWPLMSAPRDHV